MPFYFMCMCTTLHQAPISTITTLPENNQTTNNAQINTPLPLAVPFHLVLANLGSQSYFSPRCLATPSCIINPSDTKPSQQTA